MVCDKANGGVRQPYFREYHFPGDGLKSHYLQGNLLCEHPKEARYYISKVNHVDTHN